MKTFSTPNNLRLALAAIALVPGLAFAFNSGSTGADGPFSPTANTTVQLPPSGVFNYTSVTIPAGVTVTFQRNATNTPVVILASGDVTIAGTINVGGGTGLDTGAQGSGNIADDGTPGKGGPGGFDGGRGAINILGALGAAGVGPGGGSPGTGTDVCTANAGGGGGGGFGAAGANGVTCVAGASTGGPIYGSSLLVPLVGGSGGGGGAGGADFGGSGGGGGGGAILVAASGTVNITGSIVATGGNGGAVSGGAAGTSVAVSGGSGGGGSGGAIRILATTLSGSGTLSASGGTGINSSTARFGGTGGAGYIRLEADTNTFNGFSNPTQTAGTPGPIFVLGLPTLTISSVAATAAPANPTGTADITLPATTVNPVTVVFNTTNVPVGNTVRLTLSPQSGAPMVVISPALTGSTASATSSVQINIPVGASTMLAQTTYTIVASLGDALRNFAGNERVEKITLSASGVGAQSKATLVTITGKEYDAPPEALRLAMLE